MKGIAGFIDFSKTLNKENSLEIITTMFNTLKYPYPRREYTAPAITINHHYAFAGDSGCLTEPNNSLLLYRDPIGLQPLFYTMIGNRLVFASAIRALLAHPGAEARLDAAGLAELFAIGPARYEHSGIFKDIHALPPGHILKAEDHHGTVCITLTRYWDFPSRIHGDSEEATIVRVRELLAEAVLKRIPPERMESTCALLSGGVDSSVVTALAAEAYRQAGKRLTTFSFDFKNSADHFKSNAFQPDRDRPWVDKMAAFCQTRHEYLECGPEDLANALYPAVDARDLPGMADVDASLLHFCRKIPQEITTALTGECADEIFGGYPWFHSIPEGSPAQPHTKSFPWSQDFTARTAFLKDEWIASLKLEDTAAVFCQKNNFPGSHSRQVGYLTLKWFMPALLERMHCMGGYSGLEAAVPFADVKLMQYVWRIPWDMKSKNSSVKYILREAARGIVPEDVLNRKKSPFPKTYDPAYTSILAERLHDVLSDSNAPVSAVVDAEKARRFTEAMLKDPNISRPWFGQLMAGPQMMAYILQLDYWLRKYKVRF